MIRLFENKKDYDSFLENISMIAKFMDYHFLYDFGKPRSNFVDIDVINALITASDSKIVESKLLDIIFDSRSNISMSPAVEDCKNYKIKNVKVTSALDHNMILKMKEYNNFYTFNQEELDDEGFKVAQEVYGNISKWINVLNNDEYGHVQIILYDSDFELIIFIDCHNGVYKINEKYMYLFNDITKEYYNKEINVFIPL